MHQPCELWLFFGVSIHVPKRKQKIIMNEHEHEHDIRIMYSTLSYCYLYLHIPKAFLGFDCSWVEGMP